MSSMQSAAVGEEELDGSPVLVYRLDPEDGCPPACGGGIPWRAVLIAAVAHTVARAMTVEAAYWVSTLGGAVVGGEADEAAVVGDVAEGAQAQSCLLLGGESGVVDEEDTVQLCFRWDST